MPSVHRCQEVQRRFAKYDLFPSVRTHYLRMAFQIPGDATVRVSLDLDVEVLSPPSAAVSMQ